MNEDSCPTLLSAYGGPGWEPRSRSLSEELGDLWSACGSHSEYAPLKRVLLHRPGAELNASADPSAANMLDIVNADIATTEHDALAAAYQNCGVEVDYLEADHPRPNQMFLADLFFMTPQGAIIARPASEVRAGEEIEVSRRLGELGIPILASVHGRGTFEGADACWLDRQTVLLGRGLRTNDEGARQVSAALHGIDVETIQVDMPVGTMHFMCMLRIVDRDLAIGWPTNLAMRAVDAMVSRGMEVAYLPDLSEARVNFALNMVTIEPRHVLMCDGNPNTQKFFEGLGIRCTVVEVGELRKAGGAVGCLSGILQRALLD
jgi:arginine deiminase